MAANQSAMAASLATLSTAATSAVVLPENFWLILIAGFAGGVVRWLAPSTGIEPFWPGGARMMVIAPLVAALFSPLALPVVEQFLETKLQLDPVHTPILTGGLCGLFGVVVIQYVFDDLAARRKRKDANNG